MSIEKQIRKVIVSNGYICIDEFMRICMSASRDSYYRSKQPLGENADFITSPEISQMFGEMIGVWCLDQWHKLGKPNPFNLVELGPGRGLLMRDLLRGTKSSQDFHDAIHIQLLEINEILIEEQKQNLEFVREKVKWIQALHELSDIPSIIIANEFFDALPIKQYIKVKKEWKEVVLVIDPKDGRLKFDRMALMANIMTSQLALDHKEAGDGAVIEESKASIDIIHSIAEHIIQFSGAALIVDYGYDIGENERLKSQYHSTLQAVKNHQFCSILETLGSADISAHVDFTQLRIAAGARMTRASSTVGQGDFLRSLGIELRMRMLQRPNPDLSDILQKQYERLTSKDQMGNLFKVMTITQ
ncbi:MAG: SAM-dependent methyltransferase [Pseudomonadota bacterium]